jgi:hypothetical protein
VVGGANGDPCTAPSQCVSAACSGGKCVIPQQYMGCPCVDSTQCDMAGGCTNAHFCL